MRLSYLVLLFGVAACSPYNYSKEVTSFSTSVDTLAGTIITAYDAPSVDDAAALQVRLIDRRGPVKITGSCGLVYVKEDKKDKQDEAEEERARRTRERCTIVRVGDTAPKPSRSGAHFEQLRPKTMAALKVLKEYAKALAAVTNATDRAAYDAAVAQLAGAVGDLAKNAEVVAPGIGAVSTAAVNVLGWMVGTALDQQRFDSLRTGINLVGKPLPDDKNPDPDSPIHIVARTFGDGLEALQQARMESLTDEANALTAGLKHDLSTAAYRQRMIEAQAIVATLDAVRKADARGAAQDLADAHDKLVEAVNDPARSYSSLVTSIGSFADKVAAVHAALTAMSTPATATKKGS